MRTIRISEEVWQEIAKRGVFGETPDDVLRRVFELESRANTYNRTGTRIKTRSKTKRAKNRLSPRFEDNHLILEFANGVSKSFPLPEKSNKDEINNVTYDVMQFVQENGGTPWQINAGRKALTDARYHIYGRVYR